MCPNRREGVCTGFPGQAPSLRIENSVSYALKAAREKCEYCKTFVQLIESMERKRLTIEKEGVYGWTLENENITVQKE